MNTATKTIAGLAATVASLVGAYKVGEHKGYQTSSNERQEIIQDYRETLLANDGLRREMVRGLCDRVLESYSRARNIPGKQWDDFGRAFVLATLHVVGKGTEKDVREYRDLLKESDLFSGTSDLAEYVLTTPVLNQKELMILQILSPMAESNTESKLKKLERFLPQEETPEKI